VDRGALSPSLQIHWPPITVNGELIFRDHSNSHGVILLRMKNRPAAIRLVRLQQVWTLIESRLSGHFVVVTAS